VTTRRLRAARLEDVPAGRPLRVDVGGAAVLVVRAGDAVYACGAVCAHKGGPLENGTLSGARLACPWHGWMYDVRTGDCVFPGRGARVPTFPTVVEAGDVWVEMPTERGLAC
jgi:nitrite reductase/ring-hydroxylating ferredoxin subunit